MTISALEQTPTRRKRRSETSRLISQLVDTTDAEKRKDIIEQVIVINVGVAQAIASRYFGRGIPDDDLEQVSYVALTRAAQKFDPSQDRDFLTYAVPTISGELKRYFRDHGWTIRPPRRIQEIQSRVIHAYKAGHEAGQHPSADRLAAELNLPVSDVQEALSVDGCFAPASLDMPLTSDGGELTVGDMLVGDDSNEVGQLEARLDLSPALSALSPRDRRICSCGSSKRKPSARSVRSST